MVSVPPPFRADHVGSLLRPARLHDARLKHANGTLSDTALREIEDESIRHVIARQQDLGIQAVTDGELRRSSWMLDFFQGLEGVIQTTTTPAGFKGTQPRPVGIKIAGKLRFAGHPMIDDFRFLKANTGKHAIAKVTIPSPSMILSVARDWRDRVSTDVYPELQPLYEDLIAAYRDTIAALAAAGCTYLQLDDCNMAFLCDAGIRDKLKARDDDPDELLNTFVWLLNESVRDKPAGMTITMHSCRGNFKSTWMAEGAYEPVADVLFNQIKIGGLFLEYDTDRSGGFEPLRFVPRDKVLVLGLVSTKIGELEPAGAIKRRIDEATKYVDIDRLCLSPQCGFASTEEGNNLAEEEQWRKLAHVVEIAADVWAGARDSATT